MIAYLDTHGLQGKSAQIAVGAQLNAWLDTPLIEVLDDLCTDARAQVLRILTAEAERQAEAARRQMELI